jgi:hypothetical protein
MTTFQKVRTARKDHRCDEYPGGGCCGIKPGHTYIRAVATPKDPEVNQGPDWWTIKAHWPTGTCEEQTAEGHWVPTADRVETWNAVWPTGTKVWYWPNSMPWGSGGTLMEASTTSPAQTRGADDRLSIPGEAMVWLDSGIGLVYLSHVIPQASDEAFRAAHQGHTYDRCDCGDPYGCHHPDWCSDCCGAADNAGRKIKPWDVDWPCVPVLARLGMTSRRAYQVLDGMLWERLHRGRMATAVERFNAASPVGARVEYPRGSQRAGAQVLGTVTGPAYLDDDGMQAFAEVDGVRVGAEEWIPA